MKKMTLLFATTLTLLSAASSASASPSPDSLEFTNRIELYRYLQRGLENYFDTGDSAQIGKLEQAAAFVSGEYHDDFYLRQCRKFRRWRSDDFDSRKSLKLRFSSILNQLAGSNTGGDSLVRQMANLGDEFLAMGDSSSASNCWQNAAAKSLSSESSGGALNRSLQVSRLVGDLDATSRAYNLLAGYLSERMEFIRAGAYFDSARVLKAELGDDSGVADGLNNIASVYLSIGDKRNALRYAQECLAIRRRLSDSTLVYQSIISMIPAFARELPIDTLTDWLKEATSFDQASTRAGNAGRLDYCRAVVAELQGSLDSAGVFFEKALYAAASSNNARVELAILQSSAALETSLGSYSKSLENYLRAENLAAKTRNRTALATIYHNLGSLHQKLGDLESAISFYQRSLAIREQVDLRLQTGETLSNLSELYLSVGDTASALNYANRAEDIARITDDSRSLGNALISRSRLLQLQSRHEQAMTLLDSVGTISGGYLTIQRRFDLLCLKADFCRQSNKLDQAVLLLNRVDSLLDSCKTYSNSQKIDIIRSNIAMDRQEWQNAYNLLARVIARSENSRGTIPDPQLRGSFQTQTRTVYEQIVTALYQIRQSNRQRSSDDSLLFYIEKAKSRGLLDVLAGRGNAVRNSPDQNSAAAERKLLREIEQLESSLADDSLSASVKRKLSRLAELEPALSDLRLKSNVANAASQRVYSPNPITVAKLQAALPDSRTILLSYFLVPDTSYVLMISRDEFKVALIPRRAALTNMVSDYMRLIQLSIKDDNLLDSLDLVAGQLGRLLIPESFLPNSCDRIFVSTDGVLSVLPIEAVKINGKYLIEQSAVATLPSVFLFSAKLLVSPKVENWRMLAIADPKSDSRQRQLPFSAREVEWICSLFKPELCTILSASNATKAELLRLRLEDFQVIHAATHSTINYRDPTRSKIWLSSDTADVNADNYLTLAEVDDLKLKSDLVVLSSCESGGGKLDYSEGMDGFVKAFMQAGARNMLVSLWEVEDFTTATFMKTFYQNLFLGYAEALRRAKLEMINSPRLRHRHPYYWSPFVLTLSPN